jgi:hypothetical protein
MMRKACKTWERERGERVSVGVSERVSVWRLLISLLTSPLLYSLTHFLTLTTIPLLVKSQWPDDSAKYAEVLLQETEDLDALIETHEDVELLIHPDRALIYADTYRYARPETEDYIVGIIIDPVSE